MKPIPHFLRLALVFAVLAGAARAADPAPTAAPLRNLSSDPTPTPTPTPTEEHHRTAHHNNDDDRVAVIGSVTVGADEVVHGDAVAVIGKLDVEGAVEGDAVSVIGGSVINGAVHGDAVAVMGPMRLGPDARVDGDVVLVGGHLDRQPGSVVHGRIVEQMSVINVDSSPAISSWWDHGLVRGRPLAFGPHLHLLWIINFCLVALYVLLAIAFPRGIQRCSDALAKRPGTTLLTGLLGILALPVLFILLLVTVVGIPVALVILPLAVISCVLFGKAAIYTLFGNSILRGSEHPALKTLVGTLLVLVVGLVPVLGLAVWVILSFLGFSCAVAALFGSGRPRPAAPAPGTPPAPGVGSVVDAAPLAAATPAVSAGLAEPAALEPPTLGAVPPPMQPPLSAAATGQAAIANELLLPRAGFWLRMVALGVDGILMTVVTHALGAELFFLGLITYGAILWKLRGSTVGGIIFGLKVLRHDGRPIDWATATVRALACMFSMLVAGIGFIWIAFDPEKQGWHDKIAGTVVVRLPKGVPLV